MGDGLGKVRSIPELRVWGPAGASGVRGGCASAFFFGAGPQKSLLQLNMVRQTHPGQFRRCRKVGSRWKSGRGDGLFPDLSIGYIDLTSHPSSIMENERNPQGNEGCCGGLGT